jgi:proton-dependent oligopeptide transporter, POT family
MAKDPGSEIPDSRAAGAVVQDGSATLGGAAALLDRDHWVGHPRGLSTLFYTEMWERFSYYGMRAILVLFMTAAVLGDNPGLGLAVGTATAIYGLYTFFVYVLALPGGWIADNLWGQKRAVFVGGVIIMLGHVSLAIPTNITFYIGLALVVIGTGLLKPNVSAMVGDLYPEGGARRDAGFSIFYMGINIGALAGTFLVGLIGENYNFHWGFSLAAVGMFFGLVQYKMGWKYLGTAGDLQTDRPPEATVRMSRMFYLVAAAVGLIVLYTGFLLATGAFPIPIEEVAAYLGYVVVALALGYFAYLTFFGGLTTLEKKRLWVIFWLFILAALFWMGFEQAGSSMNLFARDLTDRFYGPVVALGPVAGMLGAAAVGALLGYIWFRFVAGRDDLFGLEKVVTGLLALGITFFTYWLIAEIGEGWLMPASWLQNINPFFIIVFAPIFGWLWTWLARRNANPSIPMKFALGLIGLAAGFFVLSWGAANATPENPVSPVWLVVTYFFHTVGELCLSPVGLSSMTKLAPKGRVGQMMGVWFIGAALGNLFAGITAGQLETLLPDALFWNVALIAAAGGFVALLMSPVFKKLTGGVE